VSKTTKTAAVPREQEWLNPAERDRLRSLEAVIERAAKTFIQIGRALAEIRDARLYRDTHDTFEDYCREVWDFNDSRARQIVGAVETVTAVTVDGMPEPSSERVARALTPLRDDPAAMREAWCAAVEQHGEKPTGPQVAAKVRAQLTARLPAVAQEAGLVLTAAPHPGSDIRYSRIENAASSLQTLPALDKLLWPVEPGDVAAMDEAFVFLSEWLPAAKASWRAHKARLKRGKYLRAA